MYVYGFRILEIAVSVRGRHTRNDTRWHRLVVCSTSAIYGWGM